MELKLHSGQFTIVSIDRCEEENVRDIIRKLEPFSSLTFDHAEVSLVVEADKWERLKEGFNYYREEGFYRLITFDVVLELSLVGFMALISARLAKEGVSIYALSTFLRDHILVKDEDAEKALTTLSRLIEEYKES
ncbi:MAG: ACT domain-containing protein [Candidatus Bathyarchaeota archaeon]